MTVGTNYHVKINSVEYLCKFDSKTGFQRTYQAPFIDRQSVSTSHSEGDYGQHLVFTQRSWAQGEGQLLMTPDGDNRFYTSSGMDISGDKGGMIPLPGSLVIADGGGVACPDLTDAADILMDNTSNGIIIAWPAHTAVANTPKYFARWDGTQWVTGGGAEEFLVDIPSWVHFVDNEMYALCSTGNCLFISVHEYLIRASTTAQTIWNNHTTQAYDYTALGSDGVVLYAGRKLLDAGSGKYNTIYYSYPVVGTGDFTATVESLEMDGISVAITSHNGTMYALQVVPDANLTTLLKFDGSNFVPYKNLPDGFIGQSLRSDGSVLYIGGKILDEYDGERGQIWYVTGTSSPEPLGVVTTFGAKDGTANCDIHDMRIRNNSLFFPWDDRLGLGRFDRAVGGVSSAHTQNVITERADWSSVTGMGVYQGKVYYAVVDTNDDGYIFQVPTPGYTQGSLTSSYLDFGLPATQKMFNSLTINTPTRLTRVSIEDETNAVLYPDMQDDTDADGVCDGWTAVNEEHIAVATFSMDGGQKISIPASASQTGGKVAVVCKQLNVMTDQTYTATIDYKCAVAPGSARYYAYVKFLNTVGAETGREYIVSMETAVQTQFVTANTVAKDVPEGTVSAEIWAGILDGGTGDTTAEVWFRNAYLGIGNRGINIITNLVPSTPEIVYDTPPIYIFTPGSHRMIEYNHVADPDFQTTSTLSKSSLNSPWQPLPYENPVGAITYCFPRVIDRVSGLNDPHMDMGTTDVPAGEIALWGKTTTVNVTEGTVYTVSADYWCSESSAYAGYAIHAMWMGPNVTMPAGFSLNLEIIPETANTAQTGWASVKRVLQPAPVGATGLKFMVYCFAHAPIGSAKPVVYIRFKNFACSTSQIQYDAGTQIDISHTPDLDSDAYADGSRDITITDPVGAIGGTGGTYEILYDNIPIIAGDTWNASFQYKSTAARGATNYFAHVRYLDASGNVLHSTPEESTGADVAPYNRIYSPTMTSDANSDGVCDGWGRYEEGPDEGTVTFSIDGGQKISYPATATTEQGEAAVQYTNINIGARETFTATIDYKCGAAPGIARYQAYVKFLNGIGLEIARHYILPMKTTAQATFVTDTVTSQTPRGTVRAELWAGIAYGGTGTGTSNVWFKNAFLAVTKMAPEPITFFETKLAQTEYKEVTIAGKVAPAGTDYAQLLLGIYDRGGYNAGGTYFRFKDVFIAKAQPPPPAYTPTRQGTDIEPYYSQNFKTNVWNSLGSLSTHQCDPDSDVGFYKYTLPLHDSGTNAHSLAYRLVISSETGVTAAIVNSVSVNGMTLVRAPGKTKPASAYHFSVVIADKCRTINNAIEKGLSNERMTNLRTAFENQEVVQMETIADKGVTYNVLLTNLSEVAANYSNISKTWEATVDVQALEV